MLTSDRFPFIDVVVTIGTWQFEPTVYLDTGCGGGLIIPAYLRSEILAEHEPVPLAVASGSVATVPSWAGLVEIGASRYLTEIVAMGPRFLLGRDILDRLDVRFERGKRVTIEF